MTCSTHSRRACSRSAAGSLRPGLVIALGAWVCNRTPGGTGAVALRAQQRWRRVLQACALTGCPSRPGSARLLGSRRPRAHAGVGIVLRRAPLSNFDLTPGPAALRTTNRFTVPLRLYSHP